ncbi:MAG: hypothetical protein R3E01_22545 [Pirellulaceae bacterium]|nr:hypothetical protein [Planctomycetales bacterium]
MKPKANVVSVAAVIIALSTMALAVGDADTDVPNRDESTLQSRLAELTHVALTINTNTGGVVLHAYTAEQMQKRVDEIKAEQKSANEAAAESATIRKGIDEARQAGNNELVEALQQRQMAVAQRAFRRRTPETYFRVVRVGQDYVELEYVNKPGTTKLIPLGQINQVILVQLADVAAE